ncbi:MAG TPA: ATP-dependent DNA ligase [Panacibacter sp.]|nr:ATP-dependent DNA ligase [Panacibacter sp.]HNP44897.1 ATP-dependent DNA ligase [Panacibacter sp.]
MINEPIPKSELPATGGGFLSFATLVNVLASATKTNEKLDALTHYFSYAEDHDKVWVIALFSGRRPKRIVSSSLLSLWCCGLANLPLWLYEESYHTVGDLAETIALLLPEKNEQAIQPQSLSYFLEQFVQLEKAADETKKSFITHCWMQMNRDERFVFNKLLTGGFRIGVSQKMMVNALAKTVKANPSVIAHRISGKWDPSTTAFEELLNEHASAADASKPYPFYLAYALDEEPASLGDTKDWQAEWKWDGIRGQIIKRNNELFVWSRGEELITEKFPEYFPLKELLPDGIVIDGEILAYRHTAAAANGFHGAVLPFAILQTRIGRKNISRKQLSGAPVAFFAYDLIEYNYEDQRKRPLSERRLLLEDIVAVVNNAGLQLSPVISFNNWNELKSLRETSRALNAEGVMLKRKASAYQVGRKVGDWWKWKIDPLTIDAVMVYAQKGHGRRSNLYTDYTFAVKDDDKLVTFTKAYSGLTDKEFAQVDAFVKRNSIEKFGPVRTVKPELVFEIAFEGIAASNRHKSGVALRFPRILRWRHDKKADEINTLSDLKKLLEVYGK